MAEETTTSTGPDETAAELLERLESQQLAGSLSDSTVARLATVLHGQTFAYRESQLKSGHDFVSGTVTVLTDRLVVVASMSGASDGLGQGHVDIEVWSRSRLRHLSTGGPERMADSSWPRERSAPLPRALRLVLTYEDGTAGGRTLQLDPRDRGRLRGRDGGEAQQALLASLLEDLAR